MASYHCKHTHTHTLTNITSLPCQVTAELHHRLGQAAKLQDRAAKRLKSAADHKWAIEAVTAAASSSLHTVKDYVNPLGSAFWQSDAQFNFPWFATLSERAQQNIYNMEGKPAVQQALLDGHEVTGDVSQSFKRVHPIIGGSGTVLPGGDIWLLKRKRLVTAFEKLRLQKIYPPYHLVTSLPDYTALVHSLAGNAFHTSVRPSA